MRTWLTLALLAPLSACSLFGTKVDEDNFGEEFAEAICSLQKECLALFFYEEYDDLEECADEYAEDWEDGYEDCDFDQDKAEDCIKAIREADCTDGYDGLEDAFEDCEEVWDCGGSDLPLPYDTGYGGGYGR